MADNTYQGFQGPGTFGSQYNATVFLVQSLLAGIATAALVQVKAVTNAGGVEPVGFVDINPLVAQVDGNGQPTAHGVINNVPYHRLQGGTDAVIMDPRVGDIGIAVFASRDISAVKAAKGSANPGSARRFDMADGLYLGGVLNGTPTQYVRFYDGGIEVISPAKVKIQAPEVEIDGTTTINGATTINGTAHITGAVTGDADGTFDGTSVHTHRHSGVQGGSGTSGPPV